MNRTIIKRIKVMLRTVGIPNSFWAKVAKTASYVVNRSPSTTIGLKILIEIWTRKLANYSHLYSFAYPVHVMYNA